MNKRPQQSIAGFTAAAALSSAASWLAVRNAHIEGLRSALSGADFLWLLPYPFICVALNI